jgi:hypothetical protein
MTSPAGLAHEGGEPKGLPPAIVAKLATIILAELQTVRRREAARHRASEPDDPPAQQAA